VDLLLIRHALPVRIDEGTVEGPADPALAPRGREQAEALAEWIAGEHVDALWCSPMRRARETAAPVAERLGLDPRIDDGLAEYDKDSPSYIPIEELKAMGDPRWLQVPEQPEHFQGTVVESIERIIARHAGERVAVVCHGGVVNAYTAHVLRLRDPLFFLPTYVSVSRVHASSRGHRSIGSLNEHGHVRHLL
jgi:2,3-bisphosphoglycerate-dependent phosphoglycerate mutase